MKIMLTGANGMLGQNLVPLLLAQGHEVWASSAGPSRLFGGGKMPGRGNFQQVDIRDADQVKKWVNGSGAELLIHAAAKTQVDECERNRDEAYAINVQGTVNLLEAASPTMHFLYVSTDFVFDGLKGNYQEDDRPNPVNWYGETKWEAEQKVASSGLACSIARTCLVYGPRLPGGRSNLISWVAESLGQGKPIKVVGDQIRTPTYVEDLAEGISKLANSRLPGCFHLSGGEVWTPYDMAIAVAEYLNLDTGLVSRVDAGSFSETGKRPPKTGFNISKAKSLLGFSPGSFRDNLRLIFE